ncbi:MAG TPA: glycine cleavage T C-terminal barrel domain-containing protein [Solirubrobacterales bacterium]|nr:glycine cleavage T C-terminal barrel domain-containing protein [Solirubrobacterales bacterium]
MPKIESPVELDAQYRAIREQAGLLDRSGRGKLVVRGADAAEYLQGQVTNDVEALEPAQGCYAALLDRKGHMRADMRVLRVAADELWLDAEAIASAALRRHLDMYRVGRDVELVDATEDRVLVSIVGPGSLELSGVGPLSPEHAHRELSFGDLECRAVATDLGVDLIAEGGDADRLRDLLLERGIVAVDEAAVEVVRVESGRPRFGAEMTEATIPAEAGINERAVSFTKGCYIGQETVARLHYKGRPNRHLRGLRLDAPAERGDPIALGEREVGTVGTACVSPALGPIALAVVRREAQPGERVSVGAGGGEIVELPFRRPDA